MEVGAFSIGLAVKDISASREFYEKFGFRIFGGDAFENWIIMKNCKTVIGLFKELFGKNMPMFNPNWKRDAHEFDDYTDVRELQRESKEQGVELIREADESTTELANFIAVAPDGNPILVDQYVRPLVTAYPL